MTTVQKKLKKKLTKTATPTKTIRKWIRNFVSKPNPVFGNLPPCPFAQKAIIDNKVEFVELNHSADWRTMYGIIWNFDFEKKDVLCMIADPNQFTAQQTISMAEWLNERFMPQDVVVLEDHPEISEYVKEVKLNNGEYILFLVQSLSKLNKFSKMLEDGPYYKNWSKSYLKSVKGFREQKNSQ
jgi:hypothetical protein